MDLELALPGCSVQINGKADSLRLTTTSQLVNLLLREDHRSELGTAGEKQTCVGGVAVGRRSYNVMYPPTALLVLFLTKFLSPCCPISPLLLG